MRYSSGVCALFGNAVNRGCANPRAPRQRLAHCLANFQQCHRFQRIALQCRRRRSQHFFPRPRRQQPRRRCRRRSRARRPRPRCVRGRRLSRRRRVPPSAARVSRAKPRAARCSVGSSRRTGAAAAAAADAATPRPALRPRLPCARQSRRFKRHPARPLAEHATRRSWRASAMAD